MCRYKHPDGRMCAFGPMITNYKICMEGLDAATAISDYADCVSQDAINAGEEFCIEIQDCHDIHWKEGKDFIPKYKSSMENLASRYNLEVPSDS